MKNNMTDLRIVKNEHKLGQYRRHNAAQIDNEPVYYNSYSNSVLFRDSYRAKNLFSHVAK